MVNQLAIADLQLISIINPYILTIDSDLILKQALGTSTMITFLLNIFVSQTKSRPVCLLFNITQKAASRFLEISTVW